MRPLEIPIPTEKQRETLEEVYQTTRDVRLHMRVQMVLLAVEQHLSAAAIAAIVRTNEDDEVEEVVRGAAGRLVLLYLPTYSPWLNPIEMLWRHFRREVTHCELFETKQALLAAARDFFERYKQCPQKLLSVIGSPAVEANHPAEVA